MLEQELLKKVESMTLQEKIYEITQFNYSELGVNFQGDVTGIRFVNEIPKEELWKLGSILSFPNAKEIESFRKSRIELGISEPVISMFDIIHGFKTLYPVPLGLACSFDMELIESCAEMAAKEAKVGGVDVTFGPMVDLVRDARWGRVVESAGEDPFYCGEAGKAFIRGFHKQGVACCVKHFAGYGASEAGRDYNTTDISEHTLREYYLRGYKACLDEKPELFMSGFNSLNGVPVVADKHLMIDILRNEWGFDGVLISDWAAIRMLIDHGYAKDLKECAQAAIETKHDIEMCTIAYWQHIPELIEEGVVDEKCVDEAVLRVLKLKNKLGLYEKPNRFTDSVEAEKVFLSPENRALARIAAEESFVLLKNDGVLPLNKAVDAAFVGPFANTKEVIGCWAALAKCDDAISIKSGVEKLLGREIKCAFGCSANLSATDESGFAEAIQVASNSDVIVACIGEPRYSAGEHHSRADIRIPLLQRKFIKELNTIGKSIVAVVFGGRPQVLKEIEPMVNAILYVWQPGTEGGNAIANVLFGEVNPSGKTVMSFPRSVGQCPIYYNHFNTGHPKHDDSIIEANSNFGSCYDDEYNSPLYPFGYGLSYTTYDYSDLKLTSKVMKNEENIVASVKVKNIGKRVGKETVQWYIRDLYGSYVRPLKELKGYEKIELKPGEEKIVEFKIDYEKLAYYGVNNELKAEKGAFKLFVGSNSVDCLEESFELV